MESVNGSGAPRVTSSSSNSGSSSQSTTITTDNGNGPSVTREYSSEVNGQPRAIDDQLNRDIEMNPSMLNTGANMEGPFAS